jgi:hypothetical protein
MNQGFGPPLLEDLMRILTKTAILATLIIAGSTTPTLADRAPNAEERDRIESVLRMDGYISWEEIELDDGVWEVDDARHEDGRKYDLELDPASLQIVKRDADG